MLPSGTRRAQGRSPSSSQRVSMSAIFALLLILSGVHALAMTSSA
jgi:hypothetical protein